MRDDVKNLNKKMKRQAMGRSDNERVQRGVVVVALRGTA